MGAFETRLAAAEDGCVKHRRYWAHQRYMGRDIRGQHWLVYCLCGIYIGQRWHIDAPRVRDARNEWEWVRP